MSFIVREITRRAGGGEIVRAVSHDVGVLTVGRASDNIIALADLAVLPHHALLTTRPGGFVLAEALGGSPLEIDGKFVPRAEIEVAKGARITVGSHRLTVEPDKDGAVMVTVERVAALSEGAQAEDEEKIFSLSGAVPGKRRLAWGLIAAVLLLFLVWPVTAFVTRNAEEPQKIHGDSSWSTGSLSAAHANLENDCQSCHVKAFVAVRDETCVGCHVKLKDHAAPDRLLAAHSDKGLQAKFRSAMAGTFGLEPWGCTTCHKEHEGPVAMPLTADSFCSDCHTGLSKTLPDTTLLDAGDFEDDHPEFRPAIVRASTWDGPRIEFASLADKPKEGSGLKFPHNLHLLKTGGVAQMAQSMGTVDKGAGLDCANCHMPDATGVRFRTIEMERDCGACHTLDFAEAGGTLRQLRHGEPAQVVADLRDFYRAGGSSFAGSMGDRQRPGAVGQRAPARGGSVEARIRAVFEEGGACYDCHVIKAPPPGSLDFKVWPVVLKDRYMDRAWFDHRDHGNSVTACGTCHAAETSDRAADLLLPGIAVCRDCHTGSHPEKGKVTSTCASCHSYHAAPGAPRVLKPVGADRRTPTTTETYKPRNEGGARPAR